MKQISGMMIGFLAETALHPGSGQSIGTIDQPVAREGGTNFPFVPGSSRKGSTKADLREAGTAGLDDIFGMPNAQGGALFGDVRLLLLPIRSSTSAYKWVTCPLLLERFDRDRALCGMPSNFTIPTGIQPGTALSSDAKGTRLYLEERTFTIAGAPHTNVVTAIAALIPNEATYMNTRARVGTQLLILNDDDFGWFAQFGLPVQARNSLDETTKSSTQLWYEEYLPSDTLMYSLAMPRGTAGGEAHFKKLIGELAAHKWMRVGGNETIGRGLCRVHAVGGA